jgi:hypothetical protein
LPRLKLILSGRGLFFSGLAALGVCGFELRAVGKVDESDLLLILGCLLLAGGGFLFLFLWFRWGRLGRPMHKGIRIVICLVVAIVAVVGMVAFQRATGGQPRGALTGGVGAAAFVLAWLLTGLR